MNPWEVISGIVSLVSLIIIIFGGGRFVGKVNTTVEFQNKTIEELKIRFYKRIDETERRFSERIEELERQVDNNSTAIGALSSKIAVLEDRGRPRRN